jgi:signal transduction histidine kinase
MRNRLPQRVVEWGFIGAMAILFAVLTVLQYRLTAQISQASVDRLRTEFAQRTRALCDAFDAELQADCKQLVPANGAVNDRNREVVHAALLRQWLAKEPRPIFRRMAVATPGAGGIQLYFLDPLSLTLKPAKWPAGWEPLHDNLLFRLAGIMPPPFRDFRGVLRETPVFASQSGPGQFSVAEWVIFELDLDYVRGAWLPDLEKAFLTRQGQPLGHIAVHTLGPSPEIIYESGGRPQNRAEPAPSIRFDTQTRGGPDMSDNESRYWTLDAWLDAGALHAAAQTGKWRNLALVCLLNGLLVAAGVALMRYTGRARRLAAAQMRFVSTISHELRTPLTVIRGAGQNLSRGIVREPAQIEQYGRFIIQHADSLSEMIGQMLEKASARNHATAAALSESVDVRDVLEKAIAASLTETQAAGCKVEASIISWLPPVTGNAAGLTRVFENLISNAAKYAGAGKWIGVRTAVNGANGSQTVEIQVADRGPGISAEDQASIFEPFVRGQAAESRQVRGTGLGLSLVREIIEAHRGAISVQSKPGQGATFTVRLPAAK